MSFLNRPVIISLLTQLLVKLALQVYKSGRHELLNEVEETANVRGLQGHSRLDPAKATLNCFRPRSHESRLIFETAYPFTWIRAHEALNHFGERFQKDSRLI